jgi:FtsH-binding integral membrane protein
MDKTRILATSFLVVVWWIALWGLIEIVLKKFIGNSETNLVITYCLMIVFVVSIVYMYPVIIERFL